jgi:RimJ/RimL family protein N-acetyltransferase
VDVPVVRSERLILRGWRRADLEPFASMNADPLVMEHFPSIMTRDESDAVAARIGAGWSRGFGLWAVEERATGQFVGFVGLSVPSFDAPFTPTIEIGWRLAQPVWGRGYATEAALSTLVWARDHVTPPRGEIVSFTTVANRRSRRVMEKLGFTHSEMDDFDHPALPDWEFRRHVLYRRALRAASSQELAEP